MWTCIMCALGEREREKTDGKGQQVRDRRELSETRVLGTQRQTDRQILAVHRLQYEAHQLTKRKKQNNDHNINTASTETQTCLPYQK